MPRFVLLYHECPPGYKRPSHWDLMLESGESLRTWALAELPRDWQAAQQQTRARHSASAPLAHANSVDAKLLGDHRRAYLDYEGPLSDDRGDVTRIAAGTFTSILESPARWQIEMAGNILQGTLTLTQSESDRRQWLLTCHGES